jgi:hypothetical protein
MTISSEAIAVVGGATGLAGGGATVGEVDAAISAAIAALTIPDEIADLDDFSGTPSTGDLLQWDGTDWVPYTPEAITVTSATGFIIDDGGTVIAAGIKGELPPFPFAGTITGLSLTADQSGSISVEIWKDSMTNFPPTGADIMDTIILTTATRTPTSGSYNTESHAFSAGDVLKFNVTSTATSVTRVTVGIRLTHEVGP